MPIEPGAHATVSHVVSDADTASAVGSGSLPVLGTPRLVAWCEAATCAAIDDLVGEGATSVGTRVVVDHLAPSPVGARVTVRAELASVERAGRSPRLRFAVSAVDDDGAELASGEIIRVVVDADRFLDRL